MGSSISPPPPGVAPAGSISSNEIEDETIVNGDISPSAAIDESKLNLDRATADLQLTSEKNAANGYCGLDATGKVASGQLPSYVDDVEEYANLAAFPGTGETSKIYVALDTNKTYRWSGATYVEISPSEVNSVFGRTGTVTAQANDYSHSQLSGIGASDHHAKYLDSEAVTAMGAKAPGNPLNHDRYSDSEAISAVAGGVVVRNAVISPTALTGNVNNWSPTGLSTCQVIRVDAGGSNREITGIVAQAAGRVIYLVNVSANNIKLKNEDAGSTAANRFALKADLTLEGAESVIMWYDGTSSRWRVVGANI